MLLKVISLSILIPLLAACLSPSGSAAPQNPSLPTGEGTGVRETPPTETVTRAPTETLAPTSTITPEPTATPEAREFMPANNIEFTEDLTDYNLSLAPEVQANEKAYYEDGLVNQLIFAISPSLTTNREAYEKVIADHPEWDGIGPGSDYKEKLAFMKAFLALTGGKMTVQNHNFEKFEADLNLPIKFEVIEVDELPRGYSDYLGRITSSLSGAGGLVYVNNEGQLVYSVAIAPEGIESTQVERAYGGTSIYFSWRWTPGEVISDLFRQTIGATNYKDRDSTNLKYQLYTKGGDPKSVTFYRDISWTFIKGK